MMRRTMWMLGVLGAVALARPAAAEVKHASPAGFLVVHELTVAASPRVVYDAVGRVERWWLDAHTWYGSAANLSMELRAGGCFCERTGAASVEHGRVIAARPGEMVRLAAELGPLQELGVGGVLTFAFAAAGEGTRLTVSYRVSGDEAHALDKIASAVDGVIGAQAQSLLRFIEGDAVP